jgi:endo-1,4-beta-mannosidase
MTLTRSFFYWPDFMPTPNTLDERLVNHFADFLDQHHGRGMTTIPTFLVGHMSGQNWDPAWRDGRDLYSDVWFVAQQAWYVRELTARFASHPAIAGWLLSNEIPIYGDWRSRGVGTNNAEIVSSWAQIMVDAVRLGGATQPISIGDGAWGVEITGTDNGFRVRDLAPLIDFHGPHVYRMESDQLRQNFGSAFICELLDIGGKPVVMEEFGLTSDYVSEAHAANYYRQVLHNTLLAGATGWITWNNTDYDAMFESEPYTHHPFEMHFGITDRDGKPKAQALEIKRFAAIAGRIGFNKLSRPDADAILLVSSFLEAQYPFTEPEDATIVFETGRQAYIAAREADIPIGVARELDGVPNDGKLYLVPSAKQLLSTTWVELRRLAANGATVYASVYYGEHGNQRGPWWPDLDETFGVVKQTRYGLVDPVVDDELRITFVVPFGGIDVGTELTFPVGGNQNSRAYLPVVANEAEVLAVDQHGRPALLRNRTGAGWMVLGTYPVEYFAAVTPFANPEPTWKLYDALATEAGIRRDVRVDDPRVSVGEMTHENGTRFFWFVSESETPVSVQPLIASGRLVDENDTVVQTIELEPFDVLVLEFRN